MTATTGAPETECPAFVPAKDEGYLPTEHGVWVYLHSFPAGWLWVDWEWIADALKNGQRENINLRYKVAHNIAIGIRCGSYSR